MDNSKLITTQYPNEDLYIIHLNKRSSPPQKYALKVYLDELTITPEGVVIGYNSGAKNEVSFAYDSGYETILLNLHHRDESPDAQFTVYTSKTAIRNCF